METICADIFDSVESNWQGNVLFPRSVPLHAMLVSCGYESRESVSYCFDGLTRGQVEFAIFQYTVAGEGMLDYEDRSFRMHAGEAMLLHVPHRHRYYWKTGSPPWRHLFLTITGMEAIRLMREAETLYGPVVKLPRESPPVCKAVHILELARNKALKSPFQTSSLVYDFVTMLHEYLSGENASPDRQNILLLRTVHNFCLKHLADDISVSDMANDAGFSRAHFSRIFHALYSVTPAQFLTELRLRTAIRMLQMEFCSVKEIAVRCGFKDESYFCKVFRKYHHTSPEQFRHGN